MDLTGRRVLITGGAGFIGSWLARSLAVDNDVTVVDDLSNGERDRLPETVTVTEGDLTDRSTLETAVTPEVDIVFHCAASDKYVNSDDPRRQFEENTAMTHALLERLDVVDVRNVVFTSSSTVYGEAPRPTPEDHAPLEPISVYGATKLAEEGLLSVYAHSHSFRVINVRFANVVGPVFGAGVVPDFVEKLHEDPSTLEILGNGKQEKSYLHVDDCVDAMIHVIESTPAEETGMSTYNLGTHTTTSVDRIAEIVSEEMGLDPRYEYTGGDRGWTGDVPRMRLSIDRLNRLGWDPSLESDEAVRTAARSLVERLDR